MYNSSVMSIGYVSKIVNKVKKIFEPVRVRIRTRTHTRFVCPRWENVADATNNLPSNDEDVILLLKTGKFGEGELESGWSVLGYA